MAYPGTVLLVTHDRHLIRGVADALVEVRDGRARWHEGVDESVLTPTGAPPAPAAERAPAAPAGRGASSGSDRGTRSARGRSAGGDGAPAGGGRQEARAPERGGGQRATREVRKALERAERRWERAESTVAELQARLADPDLYADDEAVAAAVAEHEAAKDLAAERMAEWEQAAGELDRLESRGA